MSAIKVFISYSWSTPEHEEWVLSLATDLVESGIDATLDKWDLKEGDESTAFMERMVSDPSISKVIIISDREYAEKSDNRKGGAGTEAQIISQKIFAQQDESKFVVAVTEKKENGTPYVPAYYTSRIFIDFTDDSRFPEKFEQLTRWIANKPLRKKPELGKMPSYLTSSETAISMPTNALKRRAIDAMQSSKPHAHAATKEYLELVTSEMERFRLDQDFDPVSEETQANFDSFIPYRDEFVEVIRAVANYSRDERDSSMLHAFFERLIPYFSPLPDVQSYTEWMFDNFKFFGQELFLYTAAILIKEERWSLLDAIVERPYYSERMASFGNDELVGFDEFNAHLPLIEHRNKNLAGHNWYSPAGHLIKERSVGSGVSFEDLVEADVVLYVRSELAAQNATADMWGPRVWYPDTLVHRQHRHRGLPIFVRSRSARYFDTIRPALGNVTKEDLESLVNRMKEDQQRGQYWSGRNISIGRLLDIEKLCTRP